MLLLFCKYAYAINKLPTPVSAQQKRPLTRSLRIILEGPLGLEPRTRSLKGYCSNQLSYGPTATTANRLYYPDFGKKVNG